MNVHISIASFFGIGFIKKGGGTAAAIMFCIIWFFLPASYVNSYWQVLITFLITLIGVWSSAKVDAIWGKDNSKVVIDEVAGMAIALLFVPQNITYLLIALLLFRFFDIIKPLGIKQLEKLPHGWGVMADDVAAGLYALIVLRLMMHFKVLQFIPFN